MIIDKIHDKTLTIDEKIEIDAQLRELSLKYIRLCIGELEEAHHTKFSKTEKSFIKKILFNWGDTKEQQPAWIHDIEERLEKGLRPSIYASWRHIKLPIDGRIRKYHHSKGYKSLLKKEVIEIVSVSIDFKIKFKNLPDGWRCRKNSENEDDMVGYIRNKVSEGLNKTFK